MSEHVITRWRDDGHGYGNDKEGWNCSCGERGFGSGAAHLGETRAAADRATIRRRVMSATDEQLDSRWWGFKLACGSILLGLVAPSLFTKAGRAWAKAMRR